MGGGYVGDDIGVRIVVRSENAQRFEVPVDTKASVLNLKVEIASVTRHDPSEFNLMYRGKALDEKSIIQDVLENDSQVYIRLNKSNKRKKSPRPVVPKTTPNKEISIPDSKKGKEIRKRNKGSDHTLNDSQDERYLAPSLNSQLQQLTNGTKLCPCTLRIANIAQYFVDDSLILKVRKRVMQHLRGQNVTVRPIPNNDSIQVTFTASLTERDRDALRSDLLSMLSLLDIKGNCEVKFIHDGV